MFKKEDKRANRVRRHARVRKKISGTAARPMREENFPPKIRREVLRSVPYVLFEERPSKVDDDDPTGYGEQYRSFDGGRHPSELPKGAADHTQDRKGEEDL